MSNQLHDYWLENTAFCPVSGEPIYSNEYVGDVRPLTLAEQIEREKQLTEPDF